MPGREIVSPSDGDVLLPVPDPRVPTPRRTSLPDDDHLSPEVHRDPADDRARGVGRVDHHAAHRRFTMPASINALYTAESDVYFWIWRHLPGPLSVRLLEALLLLASVVALLLFVIFPWVEPHLPINHVTVHEAK